MIVGGVHLGRHRASGREVDHGIERGEEQRRRLWRRGRLAGGDCLTPNVRLHLRLWPVPFYRGGCLAPSDRRLAAHPRTAGTAPEVPVALPSTTNRAVSTRYQCHSSPQ